MKTHNLGYPRIGANRELKFALEAYWRGEKDLDALEAVGREIRYQNLQTQIDAGIQFLPVNDFAYYDHVLNMSTLLGVIPTRFRQADYDLDVSFRMARGRAPSDDQTPCCVNHGHSNQNSAGLSKAGFAGAMKKWFDTNYHYIVPELEEDTEFAITDTRLFDEVAEAQILLKGVQDVNIKPVLVGPLTYLYLAENKGQARSILSRLPELVEVYAQILFRLKQQGIDWVQIDEPILSLDLPDEWQEAFKPSYERLSSVGVNILLAQYFDTLADNLEWVCELPVQALHVDAIRGKAQLHEVVQTWPAEKILSVGLVDGRNIWKTNLEQTLSLVETAHTKFADRLWIASSCSLLHVPVDLESEQKLDKELKNYLAFAKQKLAEVTLLAEALSGAPVEDLLQENRRIMTQRQNSKQIHNPQVQARVSQVGQLPLDRQSPYVQRALLQKPKFDLPLFPTTTIGSFPQTQQIRQARRLFKQGELSETQYVEQMKAEIRDVIERQEHIGLDVLVHGEPERNDMVEYFGEQLNGYAFTQLGWVQSYGSRCVKPPIIFGDVSREKPMTVFWSQYAQSQTDHIMKGMLTGAVTMLQWSFVRDDQPRADTCQQIALALRDEVLDLEAAGIEMIQIDEAALREGLPLKKGEWADYLSWAVNSFRLTTSGVKDTTQIHTHMCYSEFNDIIESVARMDADVITIETSKSHMKLLDAFVDFAYPNEIGPGVYDIHSPNVPSVEQMVELLEKASQLIPVERLWVTPDCGLKTRGWKETEPALANLVEAAKQLRERFDLGSRTRA